MIAETEQWLLSGDCNKCRRQKYCSNPCTRGKRRRESLLYSAVASAMLKAMIYSEPDEEK